MTPFDQSIYYIAANIRGTNLGEGLWELARPMVREIYDFYSYTLDQESTYREQVREFILLKGGSRRIDIPMGREEIDIWVKMINNESSQWGSKYLGHFAAVPIPSNHIPPGQYYQVPVGTLPTHHSWFSHLLDWVESAWRGGKSRGSCAGASHIPQGIVIPTGLQESERKE